MLNKITSKIKKTNFNHKKYSEAFSIVELIIVIIVIGILAGIITTSYSSVLKKVAVEAQKNDLINAATKIKSYKSQHGIYPNSITDCPNPATDNICADKTDGSELTYDSGMHDFEITSIHKGESYFITNNSGPDRLTGWLMVDAGANHTCAIGKNKMPYCWGYNLNGQVGDGFTDNRSLPTEVVTTGVLSGKTIKSISTGGYHTCAIASDDKAYCWGSHWGRLGDGVSGVAKSLTPVAVDTSGALSGKTIKSISAGSHSTCAIASDNKAYCWGSNTFGELGDNSITTRYSPVAVDTSGVLSGKDILSIQTRDNHTCVIASDYKVYCWGKSNYGQVGYNSIVQSQVPVAVDTSGPLAGKNIKSIGLGQYHSCVIDTSDKAYCWGFNSNGQLGDLSINQSLVPVSVTELGVLSGKTIKSIEGGYSHTCLIASDNNTYCFGINTYGQLGINSTTTSIPPLAVNTDGILNGKTIKSIAIGTDHSCAIASDNQIYCWGYNFQGQIGDGTSGSSENRIVPTQAIPIEF